MSSFYQPPTPRRKIVHPFLSFLFYVHVWVAYIVGAPALVFLILGR